MAERISEQEAAEYFQHKKAAETVRKLDEKYGADIENLDHDTEVDLKMIDTLDNFKRKFKPVLKKDGKETIH